MKQIIERLSNLLFLSDRLGSYERDELIDIIKELKNNDKVEEEDDWDEIEYRTFSNNNYASKN